MRRMACAVALGLVLVVVGAGCTGDGDDEGRGDEETTAPTVDESAPPISTDSVRVANLNVLHGLFCPDETDSCNAPERLAILWDLLEESGCPELVGLQEIGARQRELVPETVGEVCGGSYEVVFEPQSSNDQAMVLSRLPVLDSDRLDLAAFPWEAQWAQVESPIGTVDFLTTHFASSANNPPCDGEVCPPICEMGVEVGTCNAREVVAFLDERADPGGMTIVTGDLNQTIDHPRVRTLTDAGFVDVWTLAGNPECDPVTGSGCTCCVGGDSPYDGLDSPAELFNERIDFVLVRAPDTCRVTVDGPGDADVDGTPTGPFARTPLAQPRGSVYWASDHSGVQADIACV